MTCAAGFYLIRPDEKIGFAMVVRVCGSNGDAKHHAILTIKPNQIKFYY